MAQLKISQQATRYNAQMVRYFVKLSTTTILRYNLLCKSLRTNERKKTAHPEPVEGHERKCFTISTKHALRNCAYKRLNKNRSAFSIIELTIALALVALIAAFCIPTMSLYKKKLISNEALHIQTTCRYLQQRALAENTNFELIFNEADQSYSGGGECHKLSSSIKFGTLPGILGPPLNPTSTIKKAITFPRSKIIFYPHGTTTSGSIYLVGGNNKLLYAITIPVGNVPHIQIYDYKNGSWHKHK